MTPSTRISSSAPALLPGPDAFLRQVTALAALEVVMAHDEEDRYFSLDVNWGEGEEMASMSNGCGDQWFALVSQAGMALVGLGHESGTFTAGTPKPWVFETLPSEFEENFKNEPAFDTENSSFCVWRRTTDSKWRSGTEGTVRDDGSEELLAPLLWTSSDYVEFADEYYETELREEDVALFFEHRAVSADVLTRMNPDAEAKAVASELEELGYPTK